MKNSNKKRLFTAIISLILINTTTLFAKNKTDYYALAKNGTSEEISKEFRKNSDLPTNVFGTERETFLMLVLKEDRDLTVVKTCIFNGCDVDAKSKTGKTALMYACQFCSSSEVLDAIIKASPNLGNQKKKRVQAKDSSGKSAFDYAKENSCNVEFTELLSTYGEDPALKPVKSKKSKKNAEESKITFTENEVTEEAEEISEESVTTETSTAEEEIAVAEEPVNTEVPAEESIQEEEVKRISTEDTIPAETEKLTEVTEDESTKPEIVEKSVEEVKEVQLSEEEKLQLQKEQELLTQQEAEKKAKEQALLEQKVQIQQYTQTFLYDYIPEETEEAPQTKTVNTIADVNATDKNGVTLLMKACKEGNDWDVKNLIKLGADVNLRDADGWSALMYAVRYQNSSEIVNTLIASGAYVRVRNKYNATPLLLAADYSKNPEILNILLKNRSISEDEVFKAFIFTLTDNKSSDHIKISKVQLFIDKGISLNRMWKGKTPLMYACEFGNSTAVIQLLLENGAKPGLTTSDGKTAFDFAKTNSELAKDDIYWSLNSNAK